MSAENPRFDSLALSPVLLEVVAEIGYETLTPIQARSIPPLLEGRDLVGQSATGSGKTAAFALPVLQNLCQERQVQALILCPTRELCTQVAREIRKLGRRYPGLQVLILSGGQPLYPQLTALEKGVHIVVGTPGRVLDHLQRNTLDLRAVSTLILDEADRMLDMGFQEDMETILARLPETRQTVFFSATFPHTIAGLSRRYQRDPVRVTIEAESRSEPSIEQVLHEVTNEAKRDTLIAVIEQRRPESAIVFCNLKATVASLAQELAAQGISTGAIHGDLEQMDRDRVMAKFRNQSVRVLIATDVAARGIDIDNLDLVVNYDLPSDPEIYVHRIGRTGRAGRTGFAVALASARESRKVETIVAYTGKPIEKQPIPARSPSRDTAASSAGQGPQAAKMATLYIAGGRKDKLRPGDLLGALTGEAGGLDASAIGKIEIHDRFAYVAVSADLARIAADRLANGRIKGRRFRVDLAR